MNAIRKYFPKEFRAVYTNKFLGIVVLLAAFDLLTKYLATSYLAYHKPVEVLGSALRFTLVYNTGGIFGTFSGNLIPSTAVMLFAIILLVMMYWKEHENLGTAYGWMMVMGGALGNFIDKLFKKVSYDPTNLARETGWSFGLSPDPSIRARVGVVDFLDADLPEFACFLSNPPDCRWFIFNMADVYISCGVGLLLISMYIAKRKEAAPAK